MAIQRAWRLILVAALIGLTLAACGSSATAATPLPTLIPTHTPDTFGTVLEFNGTTNERTGYFHVADGAKILWSGVASGDNASLAITAYNRNGSYFGQIGSKSLPADGTAVGDTYVVHGAHDIALQITIAHGGYVIGVEIPK